MKTSLLILVGIVAVVVIAFIVVGRGTSPASVTSPEGAGAPAVSAPSGETVATVPAGRMVTVQLSAQNGSKESGTATLTDVGGKTKVMLKITGVPSGVSQPAHIHAGACPNPGKVLYPLMYPVDGASDTLLDVSLDALKAQLPLAINVHKNSEEMKVYVACGNVKL